MRVDILLVGTLVGGQTRKREMGCQLTYQNGHHLDDNLRQNIEIVEYVLGDAVVDVAHKTQIFDKEDEEMIQLQTRSVVSPNRRKFT